VNVTASGIARARARARTTVHYRTEPAESGGGGGGSSVPMFPRDGTLAIECASERVFVVV